MRYIIPREYHSEKVSVYILIILIFVLVFVITSGCGGSRPQINLKDRTHFSTNEVVGINIQPSNQPVLDDIYRNVLSLDIITKGYRVVDISHQPIYSEDASPFESGNTDVMKILNSKSYDSSLKAYVIVKPLWDSSMIVPLLPSLITDSRGNQYQRMIYYKVLSLASEFSVIDQVKRELICYHETNGITSLIASRQNSLPDVQEYPWMLIARQVSKLTKDIPLCSREDTEPSSRRIPVIFYVDESYRNKFSSDWKNRLQLRLLYASDIYKKLFNIDFEFKECIEWNTRFSLSLSSSLGQLFGSHINDDNSFHIGITLDGSLTHLWHQRSKLGLATHLRPFAVITAQPSYPGLGDWNSIEEALTLVHEFSHILGAIHSPLESSIMYPSAGALTYRFDDMNKYIIETTQNNFFIHSEGERFKNYLNVLIGIRSTKAKNMTNILHYFLETIQSLYRIENQDKQINSEQITPFIIRNIKDVAIQQATLGYMEYGYEHYEKAEEYFLQAVKTDSSFAEAHIYLSVIYQQLGRNVMANKHSKQAEQYHLQWLDPD